MAKRRTRFKTWCAKDIEDETMIVYEFKTEDGTMMKFSSEDVVELSLIERLRYAWVDTIELLKEGNKVYWFAKLYED